MKNYNVEFYQNVITRQWRWRVKASNGRKVGSSSEGYWNKKDCIHNAEILGYSLINHFNKE